MAVIFWVFILVLLLGGAGCAIVYIRRQLAAGESGPPGGFTLGDLRELHRTGAMTDEEFERAKSLVLPAMKKEVKRPPEQPGPSTRKG